MTKHSKLFHAETLTYFLKFFTLEKFPEDVSHHKGVLQNICLLSSKSDQSVFK